jgi:hypothetical protein
MHLIELFVSESVNEDRAIISLAREIARYLSKIDLNEFWTDDEIEPDDEFDFEGDYDAPEEIGTIGELFNTPLHILNPINIQVQSDYGIRQYQKNHEAEAITLPGNKDIMGFWFSDSKTMVLNKDYIGTKLLSTIIAHELRHALDDFKSNFKANASKRYSTPKQSNRSETNTSYFDNNEYLAQPSEINARFVQALYGMVPIIKKEFQDQEKIDKRSIFDKLKHQLEINRISNLFPEKEKSKDYKRLMKRAVDFLEREIKYQENLTGKTVIGSY